MLLDNLVGKDICGYIVERQIDETNFSVIYEAVSTGIGKRVVVKQAKNGDLVREGRILATLNHPNIEQAINYDQNHNCLVLEEIEGVTLEGYLKEKERLSPSETIKIIRQILEGLSYAHSHGIIHGDLHARNIVISDPVKIIDFGLANKEEPSYDLRLSFGTEQKDRQFDIHCVGLLLYQMAGNNEGLREAIRKATSVIAEERYKSAEEMLRDLVEKRETEKREPVFLEHKPAAIELRYNEIVIETVRTLREYSTEPEYHIRERIARNSLRRAGELDADAAVVEDYALRGASDELIRFYRRKSDYHLEPGEIDIIKELQEAIPREQKRRMQSQLEYAKQREFRQKGYDVFGRRIVTSSKNRTHSSLLARLKDWFGF